jgi:hypothetical protein
MLGAEVSSEPVEALGRPSQARKPTGRSRAADIRPE